MKQKFQLIIIFLLLSGCLAGQDVKRTAVKNGADTPRSRVVNANQLLKDLETLSADAMEGRGVGTPGSAKARAFIVERFKQSGLKPFNATYLQSFVFSNRNGGKIQGTNIIGFIKGKQNADKYIVVTAHYDHLGARAGVIYNGADDDASGVCALFAVAEYFRSNPPSSSIIFVAFDAEESGLQGSREFVAEPAVKKESIVVNVNMDMIAHNDVNQLYATGTYHYPILKPILEEVAKTAPVKMLFGHEGPDVAKSDDWTTQSDHYSFHQTKIPFVYFGVEDHKDYHKPTDDLVNINQAFYVRAVETILSTVKAFDANLPQVKRQEAELK